MKYLICILIVISLCISCKKKYKEQESQVTVWRGNINELKNRDLPVCIIWFNRLQNAPKSPWTSYKTFSQGTEIKYIVRFLANPEIQEPMPVASGKNKLSLIYYPDNRRASPAAISIVEIYFDIVDDIFAGPLGKSHILGKIILDKPQSGLELYRFLGVNFSDNDLNTLEDAIAYLYAEQDKYNQGLEVNDIIIPYISSHTKTELKAKENLIEYIRKEESYFRERYGISDFNHE